MSNEQAFFNELYAQFQYQCASKDIIIVVRDQFDCIKECVESLYDTTENFHLYLWDNDSGDLTKNYLANLSEKHNNVFLVRSEVNGGFIIPNNRLVKKGTGQYVILLNSDTKVLQGWDSALVGFLQTFPEYLQVGYLGGLVNEECRGGDFYGWGDAVDFIPGWCFCISRQTYDRYGLFDEEHLDFAYGEDSDFSLRLKCEGHKIYALYLNLVIHYGNRTISQVQHERDVANTFKRNHEYLRTRWKSYLESERVLKASCQQT
jgi:GT2 family glycosyltransferase